MLKKHATTTEFLPTTSFFLVISTFFLLQSTQLKKENLKIGVYACSYVNASTTLGLRVGCFPAKPLTNF